jgi:BlaI family transcriptional regulator, penicillinase repressor
VTKRNVRQPPLTDLHQAILDIVCKRGQVTAEQVRTALLPRHPLTDSSVRTLLRRLEARGHLTHAVEGKVFVYRLAVAPARMAARAVQQIIERFWSGSAEQFLVGMVDEKVLPPEALERLARRVKKAKQ